GRDADDPRAPLPAAPPPADPPAAGGAPAARAPGEEKAEDEGGRGGAALRIDPPAAAPAPAPVPPQEEKVEEGGAAEANLEGGGVADAPDSPAASSFPASPLPASSSGAAEEGVGGGLAGAGARAVAASPAAPDQAQRWGAGCFYTPLKDAVAPTMRRQPASGLKRFATEQPGWSLKPDDTSFFASPNGGMAELDASLEEHVRSSWHPLASGGAASFVHRPPEIAASLRHKIAFRRPENDVEMKTIRKVNANVLLENDSFEYPSGENPRRRDVAEPLSPVHHFDISSFLDNVDGPMAPGVDMVTPPLQEEDWAQGVDITGQPLEQMELGSTLLKDGLVIVFYRKTVESGCRVMADQGYAKPEGEEEVEEEDEPLEEPHKRFRKDIVKQMTEEHLEVGTGGVPNSATVEWIARFGGTHDGRAPTGWSVNLFKYAANMFGRPLTWIEVRPGGPAMEDVRTCRNYSQWKTVEPDSASPEKDSKKAIRFLLIRYGKGDRYQW
ncbi:hypothetical protein T484DRAFT_1858894, partial [Baffinella frigidus]